jgi:hypothetical protein
MVVTLLMLFSGEPLLAETTRAWLSFSLWFSLSPMSVKKKGISP